ncbi:23491_t:CDS:1, partial [Gigaspora rosea]
MKIEWDHLELEEYELSLARRLLYQGFGFNFLTKRDVDFSVAM